MSNDSPLDKIRTKAWASHRFIILKDSITYIASLYGGRLISSIFGIIIAKMLGPKDFGLWSIFALILLYGNLLDLGLDYSLAKEVPFYRGKAQLQEVEEVRNTAFTWTVIIAAFFSLIILTSAQLFSKYGSNISMILYLIAPVLLLQEIKNYILAYFVAEKNFKAISTMVIFLALLIGPLTLLLVREINLIGLPIGLALGYFLALLYLFHKYRLQFKLQININKFVSLVRIGFPIMVIIIFYTVFLTIDKVLIFKYLGKETVGYYSITSFISRILLLLPVSLGVMIFPRLSEKFGSGEGVKSLKDYIYMPTLMLAYSMPILSGMFYLLLPSAVKILLPQYLPGVNAGEISLIGIMFFSTGILAQKLLIVINRQIVSLCIILFSLALKIILIYLSINRHTGLSGVVMAANITYFVYSMFIMIFALHYCKSSLPGAIKYLIKIYFPAVYSLLILFMVYYLKYRLLLNTKTGAAHCYPDCFVLLIFVFIPLGLGCYKNLCAYFNFNMPKKSKLKIFSWK